MDFRTSIYLLSIMLALFSWKTMAREPSLAELREHLKNTTDYKCWCEECKSINDTHLEWFVWFACEGLMENMLLKLENDEFDYGHVMQSLHDLMFEKQDFCGVQTVPIPTVKVNTGTESSNSFIPGKTLVFTDEPNWDSCIHLKYSRKQQNEILEAASKQLYWAIPVFFIVLLVNVIGGIYLYFRFGKIEAYHRHMERRKEVTMPLELNVNVGNI